MAEIERLLDGLTSSVVEGDGDLPRDVRAAIEARAAMLGGREGSDASVPEALSVLVDKVALHAYKTTDADIDELKRAGYSEDAIFEAIGAAAVGAGRARYQRGMTALRGEI